MGKRYITYEVQNIQPVLVANLDISKSGEIATLQYLPGSTLRGMVIANLKEQMADEQKKQKILTKATFYNGYPMAGEEELLPSPKGFYENKKQDGNLVNIVADTSAEMEGYKRAALGRFCVWKGDTIYYTSVEQRDALNICVKDKNIFRKDVLSAGQRFRAYIAVDEEETELYEWLTEALKNKTGYVGANRTSGYGKCQIAWKGDKPPYESAGHAAGGQREVYLYLASNMSMRNAYGEICGIDLEMLARLLGVGSLELKASATSICKMSGVNRTWGCRTPEAIMYEAGSVFKLEADQDIPQEAMERVRQNGIGVKREEGCGQVLFLESYAGLNKKEALSYAIEEIETETALTQDELNGQLNDAAKEIAKKRIQKAMEGYVAEEKINADIKRSQRGIMLNYAKYARVEGIGSTDRIKGYLAKEREKLERNKKQSENGDKRAALDYLESMVSQDVFEKLGLQKETLICGIPMKALFKPEEVQLFQMELLERAITFANRKEKNQYE